jgi:cytochrome c oxidase subunit 3
MYTWWRDVIREATFEEQHTVAVQKGLRLGMVLFIVSEVMFFFAFFWAFFHSSIAPVYNIGGVWPPKAITTMECLYCSFNKYFYIINFRGYCNMGSSCSFSKSKKHTIVALLLTLLLAILFTVYKVLNM